MVECILKCCNYWGLAVFLYLVLGKFRFCVGYRDLNTYSGCHNIFNSFLPKKTHGTTILAKEISLGQGIRALTNLGYMFIHMCMKVLC